MIEPHSSKPFRGLRLLRLLVLLPGIACVSFPPAPAQQAVPPPPAAVKAVPPEKARDDDPVVMGEAEQFQLPPRPLFWPVNEEILTLAFSPDGKKLVTAGAHSGRPGQLKVWDLATGKETLSQRRITAVRAVAFSPTGKTFASGDFNGTIILRDPDTGLTQSWTPAHAKGINGLSFSRDGQWLVSAGLDNTVKLWDVKLPPNQPQGNFTQLPVRQVFQGHTDMVLSVALFPNGQAIASGSRDGTARIWDITTGKEKFLLKGHKSAVEHVAVSPDSKLVATASWDQAVRLWDAGTGQQIAILKGNRGAVFAVALSPSGELLACSTSEGMVHLWDVKSQKLLRSLARQHRADLAASTVALLGSLPGTGPLPVVTSLMAERGQAHTATVWALAFSADGKYLASGSSDRTARVWDLATFRDVTTLFAGAPPLTPPLALAWAPDGKSVALAAPDWRVKLCDLRTGEVQLALTGHAGEVTCLAFSPDGRTVASGSKDSTLKLWDRLTGQEIRTVRGHTSGVLALAYSPDGKQLASAGEDHTVRLWDAVLGQELQALRGHTAAVQALAFAPDGRNLASGGADQTIRVWNLVQAGEPRTLSGHEGVIRALAYSPSGTLASASEDGTVLLWPPDPGKEPRTLRGHLGGVSALAFSVGGRTLVSGGTDSHIVVWDPVSGQPRQLLRAHQGAVTAIAFAPNGGELISGGPDTIYRWTGRDSIFPLQTLGGNPPPTGTQFVAYSPSGDRLASGGDGGMVALWTRALAPARYPVVTQGGSSWDVALSPDGRTVAAASSSYVRMLDVITGEVRNTHFIGKPLRTVAISPDGKYLAAGTGTDNLVAATQVRLLELPTGRQLAQLDGHVDAIFAIRFTPDSKTLVTSGKDKTIRLWDVPSGKARGTITGQTGAVKGLAFLPDGTMVTASWDGTIRFWNLESLQEKKIWKVGMAVASLDISADGTLLAAAQGPGEGQGAAPLKVWEVTTGKQKYLLQGHSGRIQSVAFTPDGRGLVAVGGKQNTLREISYWDLTTGQLRSNNQMPRQWLVGLAITPDGKRVVSASTAGTAFFDIEFLKREPAWVAHNSAVTCGVFGNAGRILATGSTDSTIKLWDATTGAPLATLTGHARAIRSLAVLPDGKTLASASDDATVKLWDLATFREKGTLRGPPVPLCSLAVSPDGKRLAIGGGDPDKPGTGELIQWDLASGQQVRVVASLDRPVRSVAFSPDGNLLAAGIGTGLIQVWDRAGQQQASLPAPDVRSLAFSADGKFLLSGQGKSPAEGEPGSGSVTLWETATWNRRTGLQHHQDLVHAVAFAPDGVTVASASQDETLKLCSISPLRTVVPGKAPGPNKISIGDVEVKDDIVSRPAAVPPPRAAAPPAAVPFANQPAAAAAPQKQRPKGWLAASVLLGLVITFAFGIVLYVRQCRREDEALAAVVVEVVEEEPPKPAEPPPSVSFACSDCGKALKARGALAGKKVKCPQCSKLLLVPGIQAVQPGSPARERVVRKRSSDIPEV